MASLATRLLRIDLVVLLLGTLLGQALVPLVASETGRAFPEVAHLVGPYSAAGILAIACAQVALLAVWQLLSLVDQGAILGRRSLRWLGVITACAVAATILCAVPLVHLLAVVGVGGPGVVLALAAVLACGPALVLLVSIMRGLLESLIANGTSPGG